MDETAHSAMVSIGQIEQLYRQRSGYFARVARAELHDPEAAADAVQEAFARAIRSRDSYTGKGTLDAWVWRILINVCRNVQTRSGPPDFERSDTQGDSDRLDDVRAAFRQLTERQRLVLFLRHYADLDYQQIGEALGIERGTVAATLHAAHTRLRTTLTEVPR